MLTRALACTMLLLTEVVRVWFGMRGDGRCGKDFQSDWFGETRCGKGQCCSSHGWCGNGDAFCSVSLGCQSDCWPATHTDGATPDAGQPPGSQMPDDDEYMDRLHHYGYDDDHGDDYHHRRYGRYRGYPHDPDAYGHHRYDHHDADDHHPQSGSKLKRPGPVQYLFPEPSLRKRWCLVSVWPVSSASPQFARLPSIVGCCRAAWLSDGSLGDCG